MGGTRGGEERLAGGEERVEGGANGVIASTKCSELSVQSIVDENIKQVPAVFLKPPESLAPTGSSDEEIPIIDMAAADAGDEIVRACTEWGVFHVMNHGIAEELVERVELLSARYFSMPKEDVVVDEKLFVPSDGTRDWSDCLIHYVVPPKEDTDLRTKWPENYRETLKEFVDESLKLVTRLMQNHLAPGLGLPSNRLVEAVGDVEVVVRVNRYPPCPEPEKVLGLTSHTDHSIATVLVTDDVPGLQVFKSGRWITVKPVKNTLLIFVANILEILSNGIYKSIEHRVIVNKNRERMSLGVFHNLAPERFVEPIPELLDEDHPPMYKRVQYGQTFEDFAKLGFDGKAFLNTLRVNQDRNGDR